MPDTKTLLHRARTLRKKSTDAEQRLWRHLRARRLDGYKFKRQVIINNYIADFVCFEKALIVEVDGGQHAGQVEYDRLRSSLLEGAGFRVVRFWNNQVLAETGAVLNEIYRALSSFPPPSPQPSPRGRGSTTVPDGKSPLPLGEGQGEGINQGQEKRLKQN